MEIIYCNDIKVEVIRSQRRKTLSLAIHNGSVKVRMPSRLSLHHAETFVHQKSHWIQQKLLAHPPIAPKQFENGETLLYLGKAYQLAILQRQAGKKIHLDGDTFRLEHPAPQPSQATLKRQITDWYKAQAASWLTTRCQVLIQSSGLQPSMIEVKSYRARWGSCSASGKIQLNWKLIMAPAKIIDYVIIHELCHLREHNHSPAFWQLVGHFDPEFTHHRSWLRGNGQQLQL